MSGVSAVLRHRIVWILLSVVLFGGGCAEQETDQRLVGERTDSLPSHFRALGQEPGWLLEVFGDSLRFAWAYGKQEVATSRFRAQMDTGRVVYTGATDRGTVRVVADPRPCTDPMSGKAFSHTVTVTLDDDSHSGCGRPLP